MRIPFSIFFLFLSSVVFGENPVQWTVETTSINDSTSVITFIADIEPEWYIYSQHVEPGGPLPAEFSFEPHQTLRLEGDVKESADKISTVYDDIFEMNVIKLEGKAIFKQTVIGKSKDPLLIVVDYQVCKEVCINGNEQFAINLGTKQVAIGEQAVNNLTGQQATTIDQNNKPEWFTFKEPLNDCKTAASVKNTDDSSNWGIFILGLLGGFVALLTPCVFPMIPLTVTFFTKRHEKKSRGKFEAILYGFSIFFIYFLLALPFLLIDLPEDTLYTLSTSTLVNLVFFAIFIFFAISLFGFFEIGLPAKWANKTDEISNKGGLVGIFFMAITLAIVSFSCTGPILGSLMAGTIATEGGQLKMVYGMSGFGVALGIPFSIFALFPGVLKKLPKSGSWMNTVKVFLAFIEIALALKFLSNADIVNNWHIITYEVFLTLWIIIFLALAAYLFGWIRFPHDHPEKISIARKIIGVCIVLFTGYLASGFLAKPLQLISGFPPPRHYSLFKKDKIYIDNLEEGIAYAKQVNKPILLDFTGKTCVNCRKVEESIWPDPEVDQRLREEVVLVSLYADDKQQIDPYYSEKLGKTVRTIGGKWTDFESSSFGKIAQPLYALITPDGQLLNTPIAYTKSVENYLDFLDCGIHTFNNLQSNQSSTAL